MTEVALIREIPALRRQVAEWRRAGQRIALVPTMGSLHAGHLSLVEAAAERADRVIVSIFVNPLQFAAGEDFERYPRELDADRQRLEGLPVDLVFAPGEAEMYPHGRAGLTQVQVPGLSAEFCGEYREGHFEGVTTVVSLLFNVVQADCAVFGQKDYQQLVIIRRMVRDLHMPIEIVAAPTVRDENGLALSSRNAFLSAPEREQAAIIYASLRETADALAHGERDFAALEAGGAERLRAAGLRPQYFGIRTREIHRPDPDTVEYVILTAALLGSTRLIDNLLVGPSAA